MKCLICGKEHNNKKYCSEKCQYEAYKVKKIERINVKCLNCGNQFESLKTMQKKYCSRKCADEHKKILYIGNNNPMFGKNVNNDTRTKHSENAKIMWQNPIISNKIKKGIKEYNSKNEFPAGWSPESRQKRVNTMIEKYGVIHNWMDEGSRKRGEETCLKRFGKTSIELMADSLHKKKKTKIEEIFENFLKDNKINYKPQYRIYFEKDEKLRFRIYDFYLIDKNILIEIDGDYWHGNSLFFDNLNVTQLKNKNNDDFKNKLADMKNMGIKRLWENEILNETFKEKILEIING